MFDVLNNQVKKPREVIYVKAIIRECQMITKIIIVVYESAITFQAVYNFFADVDDAFWPSTAFYPFEFAQLKLVYWIVFIFQGIADFNMCLSGTALDTCGVFLINILGSTIEVLRYKLRTLGTIDNQKSVDFKKKLVSCIEFHKKCLR